MIFDAAQLQFASLLHHTVHLAVGLLGAVLVGRDLQP